jgi:CDP-4-dehydro-6-deoxyglucose reductase
VLSLVVPAREVVRATPRTRVITLDLEAHAFSFAAGQAVLAGLADSPVRRPYSIACSPFHARATNTIELLVQIDDHRDPDPHLERVKPGTQLALEGPFGSFGLTFPVVEPEVLLVGGGTGIAPLRSILGELLARQRDIKASVAYSARAPEEFAFLDELTGLASAGRIELHLRVTREGASPWTGARGRIDAVAMRTALKTTETRCLICGPPGFVTDVVALLKSAGVADQRIGWEAS